MASKKTHVLLPDTRRKPRDGKRDALVAGLRIDQFLRRYWHKHPHLIRRALPDLPDLGDLSTLKALAARDEVESRVIVRERNRWHVEHGPFARRFWRNLPATRWTLLVQGLNQHSDAADRLLREFAFLPYARLDDVMVSFAAPEGGVGPHFDSYDVFLVQGPGRRRWRISRQADLALDPRAPLKILRDFRAEETWILDRGDMLYLPPHIAHEGTALEACFTYSIGFRAPTHAELAEVTLQHLQESFRPIGRYADPDVSAARHPALLPAALIGRTKEVLRRLTIHDHDIEAALGQYLSTPKATVVFDRPAETMSPRRFAAAITKHGTVLDRRTIMLFAGSRFFVNGEMITPDAADLRALRALADARVLHRARFACPGTWAMVRDWYRSGWLHIGA